jgi:hypothetical protein
MSAYVLSNGQRVYPAFVLNDADGGGIVTPPASFRLSDGRGVTAIVLVDENGNIVASPAGAIETAFTDLDEWYAGLYYDIGMMDSLSTQTTQALTANTLYATLIKVPHSITIDRLACQITIGGAASSLVRLGLFANDGTNGLPGTLLVDGGTTAADTTGTRAVTVNQTLTRGRYWVGVVSDGAPTLTALTVANAGRYVRGAGNLGDGSGNRGYTWSVAHTFGALPATFGSGSLLSTNAIRLGVRVA